LPLLFYTSDSTVETASDSVKRSGQLLSRIQLNTLLFITEGLGITFYAILSAAYYWVIPSTKVLTGEPVFKIPITIFGLLYFIVVIIMILLSIMKKTEK
jgi:hypothetical protein